jgi:hypothetical protein
MKYMKIHKNCIIVVMQIFAQNIVITKDLKKKSS